MCNAMKNGKLSNETAASSTIKRREHWGATCKFSKGNRQLSSSPIPLAPHLARDWVSWQDSDGSGEEEEITLRSLDQYHHKILLGKRIPKSGLLQEKLENCNTPLHIRSLSVCSPAPPLFRTSPVKQVPEWETSPVAKHGFRTTFSARRATRPVLYQWVGDLDRSTSNYRTRDRKSAIDVSSLRVGSSPTLTSQRPNTSHTNGCEWPTRPRKSSDSIRPKTSGPQITKRPATSRSQTLRVEFHRPITSHITGRAGLKGYFLRPSKLNTSQIKAGEKLSICVKTEKMKCSTAPVRCSTSPARMQVPEPPAPSPLIPH